MSTPANDFWDQYSEVPAEGHVLRRESIKSTNVNLRQAYENRKEHPVEWLHIAYRFGLRNLLLTDYEQVTGIDYSTLSNIETPGQNVIYPSFEKVVSRWGEYANEQEQPIQEIAFDGRLRFIEAIVQEKEQLEIYKKLRSLMLEDPQGEAGFYERSQLTRIEYEHRRNRNRILPFPLLASAMRNYTGTNHDTPDADAWHNQDVQDMRNAYIEDMFAQRGVPKPLSKLQTATEFAGLDFQEVPLHELGLSGTTVTTIISQKKLVEANRIENLTNYIRGKLGDDVADTLLREWSAEMRLQVRRKSFAATLRSYMERDNLKPEQLLMLCGVDVEPHRRGEKLRQSLERGPNKSMPPVAMLAALAHDKEEYTKGETSMRRDFRMRWTRSNRRKPDVPAALSYFGVHPEEIFPVEDELSEYRKFIYGEPSSLREKDVLARIEDRGRTTRLLPTLRRAVEQMTPRSLEDLLNVLASRNGGLGGAARAAGMHLETVKIQDGKAILPKFLTDLFENAGIEIPPHIWLKMQFQYAERNEAEEFTPLGRALDYEIASRDRFPHKYVNRLRLHLPNRPSHLHQLQQATTIDQEDLDAIFPPETLTPECKIFLKKLNGVQGIPEALCKWYQTMVDTKNEDTYTNFDHLIQMVIDPPEVADLESSTIDKLFARKSALHAWRRGQPYDDHALFGEQAVRAAAALRQLPGVSRADIIQMVAIMPSELQEKLSSRERMIRALQQPTHLAKGSEARIELMRMRAQKKLPLDIPGDRTEVTHGSVFSSLDQKILRRVGLALFKEPETHPLDEEWSEEDDEDDEDNDEI